jgi:type II secretory pathway pseudopilin PulG
MSDIRHSRKSGLSLLELIIIMAIIGAVAAIAIPRLSRSTAATPDSTMAGDLAVLRNAVDLFIAEHDGKLPTLAQISKQLTLHTDSSNTSGPVSRKDPTHLNGPYLRAIPPLPAGANTGNTGFTSTLPLGSDTTAGWFYDETTGKVKANTADTEVDQMSKKYSDY